MHQNSRYRKRSFSEGVGWLSKAAELLSSGGSALVGVAALFLLVSMIQFLPLIGSIALVMLSPLLTAGLMTVFRLVSEGTRPQATLLFAGWHDAGVRFRLLTLGAWLLLGTIAAIMSLTLWLAPQMDMDALTRVMNDPDVLANDPEALFNLFAGVNLFGGLVLFVVIMAIVLSGLYFAIPLVLFWKWPVVPSLIFSIRAMLGNWLAFLGFGMVLLVVLFAAGFMFALLVGILGLALGQLGALLSQLVFIVTSLFIQLLLAATQWVAFQQVFQSDDSISDDGDNSSDQDSGSLDI